MAKAVREFNGKFSFLSNFFLCSFTWDGIKWPHAEAAYQAAKTLDQSRRLEFVSLSPGAAKRRGQQIGLREDWEQVKLEIMAEILYAKFEQNPELKTQLINLEGFTLEEGNYWGDRFWGISPARSNKGKNNLGKLLEELRDLYIQKDENVIVIF